MTFLEKRCVQTRMEIDDKIQVCQEAITRMKEKGTDSKVLVEMILYLCRILCFSGRNLPCVDFLSHIIMEDGENTLKNDLDAKQLDSLAIHYLYILFFERFPDEITWNSHSNIFGIPEISWEDSPMKDLDSKIERSLRFQEELASKNVGNVSLFPSFYWGITSLLHQKGRVEASQQICQQLLLSDRSNSFFWILYSNVENSKNSIYAEQILKKAMESSPSLDFTLLYHLCQVFIQKKDFSSAISLLCKSFLKLSERLEKEEMEFVEEKESGSSQTPEKIVKRTFQIAKNFFKLDSSHFIPCKEEERSRITENPSQYSSSLLCYFHLHLFLSPFSEIHESFERISRLLKGKESKDLMRSKYLDYLQSKEGLGKNAIEFTDRVLEEENENGKSFLSESSDERIRSLFSARDVKVRCWRES